MAFNFTFFTDFVSFFWIAAASISDFLLGAGGAVLVVIVTPAILIVNFVAFFTGSDLGPIGAQIENMIQTIKGNSYLGLIGALLNGLLAFTLFRIIKKFIGGWI